MLPGWVCSQVNFVVSQVTLSGKFLIGVPGEITW